MNSIKDVRFVAIVDKQPHFIKAINFEKKKAFIEISRAWTAIAMADYAIVEITDFKAYIKEEKREDYIYEKDIIFWWDTIDGKYCPRYAEVIFARASGAWEAFTKKQIYLLADIKAPQLYKRSWLRRDFDGFQWGAVSTNDDLARGVV